ncbi:MAG: ATP synthase subunit C [Clostridium sp.]|uniref:ATP synthase subunit C n=1 Tax=Clostridium sp. TaxID=1506 RepID=UPI002910D9A0|nr:ATP synthase subunit C [Clostridium sp.]MDU7336926.1 ATP synthase subunit C [Clostridium sp.]
MNYVLFTIPVAALILSILLAVRAVKNGKKAKTALVSQIAAFMIVCAVTIAVPMVASAATEQPTATTTSSNDGTNAGKEGLGLLAAGLVTGLAGIGGGIAVGAASPAAIGATAEDPKSFGKSLIFVALGEGIALYGLLISILILNKI